MARRRWPSLSPKTWTERKPTRRRGSPVSGQTPAPIAVVVAFAVVIVVGRSALSCSYVESWSSYFAHGVVVVGRRRAVGTGP
eukprot:7422378-Pyramimonas_sp.AAC.1